jgi:hypothetical protein
MAWEQVQQVQQVQVRPGSVWLVALRQALPSEIR